jgi:hypothetical protein
MGSPDLQFERINGVNGELRYHTRNSTSSKLGPGVDVCRVTLTLKLRKGAFCSLLRLGIVLQIDRDSYLVRAKFNRGFWHHFDDVQAVPWSVSQAKKNTR